MNTKQAKVQYGNILPTPYIIIDEKEYFFSQADEEWLFANDRPESVEIKMSQYRYQCCKSDSSAWKPKLSNGCVILIREEKKEQGTPFDKPDQIQIFAAKNIQKQYQNGYSLGRKEDIDNLNSAVSDEDIYRLAVLLINNVISDSKAKELLNKNK